MNKISLAVLFVNIVVAAVAQSNTSGFRITPDTNRKEIAIEYNGTKLTAYCYYDSVFKPILFPINTTDGITVTRGYPLQPVAGEKTDHPHHTGMWMNYESVNGIDFWNNSTAIPADKKNLYGTIVHTSVTRSFADKSYAGLSVTADWRNSSGETLVKEATDYKFTVSGNQFFIDRHTTLTATEKEVVFKDIKDGFFGMRVARELEMPSKEPATYIDAHGNKTKIAADRNGVTGWYVSSEGKEGDSVWGTKGIWTMLTGKKQNEDITITIFDHPKNPGYPTYWHARGYGLFAANPLGRKIFSNGKEELNLTLKPGASVEFHYLVLVQSGAKGSVQEMNGIANQFAKQ